jgi:hypothetical protein
MLGFRNSDASTALRAVLILKESIFSLGAHLLIRESFAFHFSAFKMSLTLSFNKLLQSINLSLCCCCLGSIKIFIQSLHLSYCSTVFLYLLAC